MNLFLREEYAEYCVYCSSSYLKKSTFLSTKCKTHNNGIQNEIIIRKKILFK